MPMRFAKGALITAAIAAAALWLARAGREPAHDAAPIASQARPSGATATAVGVARPPPVAPPAAAKLRELQALSETFRNTTFLIAIRDAGFVCTELLGAYGGVDSSHTWTATCADMLAYTVSVTEGGALAVEPMLQYLDGTRPRPPVDRGREAPPRTIPLEPR
jgi:hypothetical protein